MRNFLFIILILSQLTAAEKKMVIRFDTPSQAIITEFTKDNYDIAAYKPGNYLDIVVSDELAVTLSTRGYDFHVTQTEMQLKKNLGDTRDLVGYREYEELLAELQQLENDYPNLCKLYDMGETWGKEYYNNGNSYYSDFHHEVWALKLSDNVEIEEDEPSVYYMGEHHAREPISLEVVMAVLHHLIDNYGSDSEVTQRVDNTQIWFVPLVNPNGHRIVTNQTDTWWRKNIRDNNENGTFDTDYSSGYGIDGVDPNRNYGFPWGDVGTSDEFDSPVYHGPEAWSEPEISAMRDLLEAHHFVAGISYHSYSELVLFPYGYEYGAIAPDHEALDSLAIELAESIPALGGGHYTPEQSLELYPCMGTTDDYSYGVHGTFAFTVELATQFIPPSYQIDGICDDNIEAAMILLDRVNRKTLTGHVTDATSGEPVVATVFIEGVDNTGSFRHPYKSDEAFGKYYRFLSTGTYDITFSAFGYLPVVIDNVVITPFSQTVVDVTMEPAEIVTVSGNVTDAETSLPLENVTVELINTPYEPVITGDGGVYVFNNVFENLYTIRLQAEGFSTIVENINVTINDYVFDFAMSPSVIESFESGVFSEGWSFDGQSDWVIDNNTAFDGVHSARSGNISNNQTSQLIYESENASPGVVSFYRKTSSEANYDYLKFYIDDNLIDQWAGETDWEQMSYPVPPGSHTYRWNYVKDSYVSDGSDCGWIDYIEFPPVLLPPNIIVDPTFIEITSEPGEVIVETFTIGYTGDEDLNYYLTVSDSWIVVNPTMGIVTPGQSDLITVFILAEILEAGDYYGVIEIVSNDPDDPMVLLTIHLTVGTNTTTMDVNVMEGWNLVSLPVGVEDSGLMDLFPNAVDGTLFDFQDGYIQQDTLRHGAGYWLRFDESGQISIAGSEISQLSVSLTEGWNLISGISSSVSVSSIADPDELIIPNTIYGFNVEGYINSDILTPGEGYWLRSTGDGEIIFTNGIAVIDAENSGCVEPGRDASLNIIVEGNTVTLQMFHPELNCCLESVWNGWLEDAVFHVNMEDVGPPCDCICAFELSASFGPFEPGIYTLDFWSHLFGNPTFTIESRTGKKLLHDDIKPSMIQSNSINPVDLK